MESHFQIIFLSLLIFGSICGSEAAFTRKTMALIHPRQRPSLNDDMCQVSSVQPNKPCCICPGECGFTHPRDPVKTYSAGITHLPLTFNISKSFLVMNFQIFLCRRNSKTNPIFQDCLLQNPLRLDFVSSIGSERKVMAQIPENLTCHNCLLQWSITGGENNIQYYGCSDIAILSRDEFAPRSNSLVELGSGIGDSQTSTPSTSVGSTRSLFRTSHRNPTQHRTTVSNCWAVGLYATVVGMHEWCKTHCVQGFCPKSHCQCLSNAATSPRTSTKEPTITDVPVAPQITCKAVGIQARVPGMDQWCQTNCIVGHCPTTHCICTPTAHATTTKKQLFCKAIGQWSTNFRMHEFCTIICNRNSCPASLCKCSFSDIFTTMSRPNISTTASTPFSSRTSNSTIVPTTDSNANLSTERPTTPIAITQHPSDITTKNQTFCRATGIWAKVPGMHEWCVINCRRNYCPSSHCICSLLPTTTTTTTTTTTPTTGTTGTTPTTRATPTTPTRSTTTTPTPTTPTTSSTTTTTTTTPTTPTITTTPMTPTTTTTPTTGPPTTPTTQPPTTPTTRPPTTSTTQPLPIRK